MAVRDATDADLPTLLPLLRGYCDFYEATPSDEGLERMARAVIAAPEDEAFLLVATDDSDAVVGFAACAWKWSSLRGARIVVLDDLFVAETARGGGHADALIEATADDRAPPRRRRRHLAHRSRQPPRPGGLQPRRRPLGDLPRVRARALVGRAQTSTAGRPSRLAAFLSR